MIADYTWRGGREAMLALGPSGAPTVLLLSPLFEEANRTRALMVAVMRALAAHGIASLLPDLPGTGDSLVPTVDARFEDWDAAVAALAATLLRPRLTAAFRGGALLDRHADARWRLSPETGARVLRDIIRATALTSGVKAGALEAAALAEPTVLAGNLLHPALVEALRATELSGEARTMRLEGDAQPANALLPGKPLWRAAEPGQDLTLASAIADDIATWADICAAR